MTFVFKQENGLNKTPGSNDEMNFNNNRSQTVDTKVWIAKLPNMISLLTVLSSRHKSFY